MVLGYLQRSEFTKNILILASGSTVAQLIPLLAEPVLSRIFTPAEFGVFEVYVALVMMLGVIATARYEMAIVLPRTMNKAINLLALSLTVVVLFTLLITLILLVANNAVLRLIPVEGFGKYVYFVPLGILLFGINRSLLFWSLRHKEMKTMSFSRITESSAKAGTSILFGALNFSSLGLILGQLAGLLSSAFLLTGRFIMTDRRKLRFLSAKVMLQQSKKYKEFPAINVPIALSEMIQVSGIIFIFSFFFDNSSVGEFSKALRILLIPLNLIGTSISQAFYQKASKDYSKGTDISKNLNKILINLLKWSIGPLVVFLLISPWLFGFVLGNIWVTSGEYARILAVWIFMKLLITPVTMIPLIINKQQEYFWYSLIGNLLLVAAIVVPGKLDLGINPTLYLLTVSQVAFLVFLYFKVMSTYRHSYQFSKTNRQNTR